MIKFLLTFLALTGSALWLSPPSLAVELDAKQPIEISANALEVLQEEGKAIFSGQVEAQQGNITLKSDRMTVFYHRSNASDQAAGMSENFKGISRLEVSGDVLLTTPAESARSRSGTYHVDQSLITLHGDVILARGQNTLRGERLDYHLGTQKSLLTAGKNQQNNGAKQGSTGRVKGVFVPNQP